MPITVVIKPFLILIKLFKELTGLTPKAYRIKWELGGKKPWKKEGKEDLEFMVNIQS